MEVIISRAQLKWVGNGLLGLFHLNIGLKCAEVSTSWFSLLNARRKTKHQIEIPRLQMGFEGRSNSHYLFPISSPSKKSPQHHLLMSYGRLFCLSLSPSPIFPPLPCLSLPTRLWSSLSFGKDKWSEIRRGDSREEERGLCIWGTATPQWYWHSVSWNGLRENTYHIHIHLPEGPLLSHVLRPKSHFIGVQRKTDGVWELCADVWDGQWQKFSSKKGEYEQSKLSSWTLITAIDLWNTYGPMCEDVICVKGLTYSTKS